MKVHFHEGATVSRVWGQNTDLIAAFAAAGDATLFATAKAAVVGNEVSSNTYFVVTDHGTGEVSIVYQPLHANGDEESES